jgi:hypothetical protein
MIKQRACSNGGYIGGRRDISGMEMCVCEAVAAVDSQLAGIGHCFSNGSRPNVETQLN